MYQLAQTCYYLSRLVVLSYKKGLNQVLRAPGEFVCFFNLAREVIFAKTNYFYYSKNMDLQDSTKCDPIVHDVAEKEIGSQSQPNHNGCLELATPNQNYLVFNGCLFKIIRRPDRPQEYRNKLFIFMKDENPVFIEQLAD